ncbi:MAG: (d)CMP kinase [bacterium]
MTNTVIAIDGPGGVGKSTLARGLAGKLGYLYLDTGALYRAVGLKVYHLGMEADKLEEKKIAFILKRTVVSLKLVDNEQKTFLEGVDVSAEIRKPVISRYASAVSQLPVVRKYLLDYQRERGKEGGIVAEGRDIGTVIFPDAELKFFVTADPEIRARRRYLELSGKGHKQSLEKVLREINDRDRADRTREHAPLKQAEDAILLDTSDLDEQGVLNLALDFIQKEKLLGL